MTVDHEQRAGRLWPILTSAASERELLTYRQAAERIGIHWRPMAHVLGPIQTYCLESGLPRLTAIVYSKATGLPGDGFLGTPGDEGDLEEIFQFDWTTIENPFSKETRVALDRIADEIQTDPDLVERYVTILSRGDRQRVFRRAVLGAYGHQCAVCGNTFEELLEAAHIIPWSSGKRHLRIDPRNGICLCANHHKLFDAGWISIDEEYLVSCLTDESEWSGYADADRQCSVEFHGKSITLPKDHKLRPWPAAGFSDTRLS